MSAVCHTNLKGVVVERCEFLTGNARVLGLISDPALMFIGKALLCICHYIPKEHYGRNTPKEWIWGTLCVNESDDRMIMISVKHFGLSALQIKIHNHW